MREHDELMSVIDNIYESALDSSNWVGALDGLCEFVGAIAADLYLHSESGPSTITFTGISDDLMNEYLAHFHDQNLRTIAAYKSPEGSLITDFDIVSPEEIAKSPYYQDLLFKNGYGLYMGGCALNRANEKALFAVHYAKGKDGYQAENFKRLKIVMPHIRRATQLQIRLNASIERESKLAGSIDTISSGIVLLNSRGQVTHVNRTAERLLGERRGLFIKSRRLIAVQYQANRKLIHLVGEAVMEGSSSTGGSGVVLVRGVDSKSKLLVSVSPLPLRIRRENSLGAILIISDPSSRVPAEAKKLLRSVYGFTQAESRLSIALTNGESLQSYAKRNNNSIETVRSLLKRAMKKTDVCRQALLVRLVLNAIAPIVLNTNQKN